MKIEVGIHIFMYVNVHCEMFHKILQVMKIAISKNTGCGLRKSNLYIYF